MAAIDRNAAALGVPTRVLMEAAGGAVARTVEEVGSDGDTVAIVCGRGDNGGDGLVAARYLERYDVSVHLVGDPAGIGGQSTADNWQALEASEIDRTIRRDSSELDSFDVDLIVDGLLGTGVRGEVREPVASAIEAINATDATVVSVDVPSGIDPDSGAVAGVAVDADRVVTFHAPKPAHADLDVPVTVADIGIPTAAERFVGPGDRLVLDGRDPAAHKGDHGRVLVIGGGPYTGAPALSGLAALRAGGDLAEVATPESAADAVAGYGPDLIVTPLEGDRLSPEHLDALTASIAAADVLAIGPGLGDAEVTIEAARRLIEADVDRVVVDADALAALPDASPTAEVIATPHAGEFAAMGFQAPADWEAATSGVKTAAQELDATVLLKGRYDVASDGETVRVNRTGNPGMTVGGTGDVLTGVVAALAHRARPIEAAAVGAWANGGAGDRCLGEIGEGFLASDVVEALPAAMALESAE